MVTVDRKSAFWSFAQKAWPHRFTGRLEVGTLVGGIPSDPNVAEGWLRTKIAGHDDLIRQAVAETMAERGIDAEAATKEVDLRKNLNGFKRTNTGELYIEGRQLKAAIKEACSIAAAAGKIDGGRVWGTTKKGLLGYVAEHVCVMEDQLPLGVTEPTGINQRFVHTFRGSGIQYEEYVTDAVVDFTIATDHNFTREQWAMIWLTGEQQGIGATRSQGYGRYVVTKWEKQS